MLLARRWCTTAYYYTHSNIAAILKKNTFDEKIKIRGWVKALRRQKELTFVDVNDGSSFRSLQVVFPSENRPESLGYHSSLTASGVLRTSSHKGQDVELLADQIEVIGDHYLENYPFKPRTKSTLDYVRQYPHLRARTNFNSLLRVRSQAKVAIQQYFGERGYINIDTPLLTSNDCEGAGEVFTVETRNTDKDEKSPDAKFFNQPVYLTVSGQLHLEAMVSGLSKVYNFSPAFRAENSQTRRHLCEFWMVEAEEAFLSGEDGFSALKEGIESLIKSTMQFVLDKQEDDVLYYWKQSKDSAEKFVQNALHKAFAHLPYHEALEILLANNHEFQIQPIHGEDLAREHELFLCRYMGNIPVFVTDWPINTKAFYMGCKEEDPNLVYGLDLLFPRVGEVVGGGLREHRLGFLQDRLQQHNLSKNLDWYLDLRRFNGRVPSGGFGLGFERLLIFLLGIRNIKDTVPFPRWGKHCSC